MSFRRTFVRARWLLLLLPLFSLASAMQVGCTASSESHDDFAHEDLKAGTPSKAAGYGYDDDGYGYGYYE